ncbi:hypothetical protein Q0812_10270 [Brevundimonas sp. 2R-24]|uniref:Uncharacterized protein n=1 Tax=Peiella sedimenti TaxID=3061083 RepID=A0ABT8SML2_9CAUL|nr:hypothetical protein [Caulobacteraceae bacterium XZ-24]
MQEWLALKERQLTIKLQRYAMYAAAIGVPIGVATVVVMLLQAG